VRAATPAEGMEKFYDEIKRVLHNCGREGFPTYRGSTTYLPDESTPVELEAARDLVERALAHSPDNPLYVLSIGCITNVVTYTISLATKPCAKTVATQHGAA